MLSIRLQLMEIWERVVRASFLFFLTVIFAAGSAHGQAPDHASERAQMIDTIRAYGQIDVGTIGKQGISETVLRAMEQTRRHLFIPKRFRPLAYADRPVPIGHGQTISQPFIVALMTHLASVEPGDKVLEIGTGSGYQAAILARLVDTVCTIEIVRPLGETARDLLHERGYDNVRVRIGDGYKGWPDCGPFDAVVVTAALDHIPPPLIEQLKVGGKLVMPVGPASRTQQMTVLEKTGAETTKTETVGLVRFVPFTRAPE